LPQINVFLKHRYGKNICILAGYRLNLTGTVFAHLTIRRKAKALKNLIIEVGKLTKIQIKMFEGVT